MPSTDEDDRRAHGLFATLRRRAFEVSDVFGARLDDRIERFDRERGPGAEAVLSSLIVELFNLVSANFSPRDGAVDDGDDER